MISSVLGWIGVVLSIPVWAYFLYRAWKVVGFVRSGGPSLLPRTDSPAKRLWRVVVEVFGHTHFKGKPLVNAAHWAVMVGFLFGIVVWFEAYIQTFNPAGGWPILSDWPVYHFLEEVLAVATIVGIVFLIGVRLRLGDTERGSRFYNSTSWHAYLIEAIVLTEGLGMLLVKAAKIAAFGGGSPWADFVSIHVAKLLPASPALVSVFALVKLLGGMVFVLFVARNFNAGVAWHRFTSWFNIFFQRNTDGAKALGKVPTPSLDDDPLVPGSWKMLLDTTACTECGRCQDLCPAWNTGKPLSPKKFIMDIRDGALDQYDQHAGVDVLALAGQVDPDVLWSCTNCGACVDQCPVDIEHIDHIADLRRFKVLAESDFPSELTGLFKNIETKGNPWGRNASERAGWVEEARRDGLTVPVIGEDVEDFTDTEYLFWVGCAGAYDDAGKRTTRAVVELLETAGVKYAVLSTGETCTGDPARRAGNEYLFQMQATDNVATLNDAFDGVPAGHRKIITTCPHCFNTIRNEYPDFDGHFDVFHHTQLLNRLVRDGRLTPVPRGPENRKPITYHDPCFLGRHNKVFDPPRELLESTGVSLVEMDKNRDEAFCCGAGGARMFMEENIGQRINEFRTEQAVATGADEIATGCPFCNNMFGGGAKALGTEVKAKDVAVMLRDSVLNDDGLLPTPASPSFVNPARGELTLTPKPKPKPKPVTEKAAPAAAAPTPQPAQPGTVPPPAAPAAPAAPATPRFPAAPAVPTAPSAPVAPSVPSAPATPGVPPAPAAPSAPSAPAAPVPPIAPAAPSVPSAPATPGVPPAPAVPSAPSAPAAPAVPSAPAVPAAPTPPAPPAPPAPNISAAPEAPAQPPTPPIPPTAPPAPPAPGQ